MDRPPVPPGPKSGGHCPPTPPGCTPPMHGCMFTVCRLITMQYAVTVGIVTLVAAKRLYHWDHRTYGRHNECGYSEIYSASQIRRTQGKQSDHKNFRTTK